MENETETEAQNDSKLNELKLIIRNAMSETKRLEWSKDPEVARMARLQWNALDSIFKAW